MGILQPDEAYLGSLGAFAVYAVVFGFVFVESGLLVGFVLPGDSMLFAAGLISAAESSAVDVRWLVLGVLVAAVSGDAVGFLTGSRLGRPWLVRRMERGRLDPRHLARAEHYYERWGVISVVIARFIPWVRTFTPIVAGASRMSYGRFLPANVVGALLWGAGIVLLGHYSAGVPWLRYTAYAVAGTFVALSVVVGVAAWVRRRRTP